MVYRPGMVQKGRWYNNNNCSWRKHNPLKNPRFVKDLYLKNLSFFRILFISKNGFLARLKHYPPEKGILFSRDIPATYMLSNIFLEYDAIYEKGNAIIMIDLDSGTRSVSYTKVTSMHCQTQSKKRH